MKVINFSDQNSIINQYLAEMRDKDYQQNRLLFRNNIQRVGEMMAYEISKSLEYRTETVKTSVPDCPSIPDSSMSSTMPETPSSVHTANTPTRNIPRWAYI